MDTLSYVLENENRLTTFQSNSETVRYAILEILDASPTPLGSWALQEKLMHRGRNLSAATIGRYLKELDISNCTVRDSNKGRTLTSAGRQALQGYQNKIADEMFHLNVKEATEATDISRLVDIYTVRKAIEVEAVRLCVHNMTAAQHEALRNSIHHYQTAANKGEDFLEPSLHFHAILGEGSGNSVMSAVIQLLLNGQKAIETEMEELVTRHQGLFYASDHQMIYEAIVAQDEETAVEWMRRHMDRMIQTLSAHIRPNPNA